MLDRMRMYPSRKKKLGANQMPTSFLFLYLILFFIFQNLDYQKNAAGVGGIFFLKKKNFLGGGGGGGGTYPLNQPP